MEKSTTGGTFIEKYGTPLAVVAGAIIIAGAFAFGRPDAAPNDDGGTAKAVDIKDVQMNGDPYIGSPDAPVVMAYWFDYQCPFCKQFDTTVMTQLHENYVKTGKLRVIFKDFQFLGSDSTAAAQFARAMWDAYPDKFYVWYQAMFEAQDDEGDKGFGDLASIQELTKKIPGVDVARVTKLMNENKSKYDAAIAANRAEASKFGVNGTPAGIIGTTLVAGAQPYSTIAPLIDAELAKK
ncbi:MAG: thiol:disulfide interchange protein [Parcubacteria bacterium C7867-001]|nr:MAG: thiol:disulfide interchange protein [Parcubacteria bacterium C7867-001]